MAAQREFCLVYKAKIESFCAELKAEASGIFTGKTTGQTRWRSKG